MSARVRRVGSWLLLAVVVGFVAFCLVWRLEGGRWERVETPSMGEIAPVGSLLWVKPVDFDSLEPGDFITFRQPGNPDTTYSHLVHTRNADGTVTTKGVIPAADPWHLTSRDVVGEVKATWHGVGWVVAAAPVLIVGGLLVGAIRALVREDFKLPVVIVLGALVVTVAIVWYRPFINARQLAFAPAEGGGAEASYVGTGLLPIRLSGDEPEKTRESVVLSPGEVGRIHVTQAIHDRRLQVRLSPAVPWLFWVGLVLVCFAPALGRTAADLVRRRR